MNQFSDLPTRVRRRRCRAPTDPRQPVPNPLPKLLAGEDLPIADAEHLFERLVLGKLEPAEIAGMLIALRMKGETAGGDDRRRARACAPPRCRSTGPIICIADCCGTGGDGSGLINVSTATAFVAAACGLPIAKHGNRSVSSRCGSADVLEALGAKIDVAAAKRATHARRDRLLLPVRAGLSSRDEACGAGPPRSSRCAR